MGFRALNCQRRVATHCSGHRGNAPGGRNRRARVSGRMDNHERKVGADWNVALQGHAFDVVIAADGGSTVGLRMAANCALAATGRRVTSWPDEGGDAPLVLKVGKISGGFRIRTRGRGSEGACAHAASGGTGPSDAGKAAAGYFEDAAVPDAGTGRQMDVEVGDEVQEGQSLCTVEAMKMENILRAEKKGVVSKINASAGDSLAVDDVIMEFE